MTPPPNAPETSSLDPSEQLRQALAKKNRELDLKNRVNTILEKIHRSETFAEVLPGVEEDMLYILQAERITVYQRSRTAQELISKYKSGQEIREIRVPFSPTSIAGYVALNQRPIKIRDVYDVEELKSIHPELQYNTTFDKRTGYRCRSMMVLPIKDSNILLGVVQVINKIGGGEFSTNDFNNAQKLAQFIGQKFRYEFQVTRGRYDWLLQNRRIKAETLEEYEKRAGTERTSVAHLLITEGGVSPAEVGESLSHYFHVPYQTYDPTLEIPRHLLTNIPDSYLRRERWVPIAGDQDEVIILIDDPTDTQRIMELQQIVKAKNYVFKVGTAEDILRFINGEANIEDTAISLQEIEGKLREESQEQQQDDLESESDEHHDENEATVISLVNSLIIEAYRQRASDIHIEPSKGKLPADVRYRIDGVCKRTMEIPPTHIRAVVARIKIMAGLDISERRKPQDGKCVVRYQKKPIELRVATLPTVHGESAVLRILASSKPLPVDKINLSTRNEQELKKIVEHPHGIFLVVGPTGSGKTTTLHAILGYINTPERKIWTAEDPVEITQVGLQQVQMNAKINMTFAAALRAFLRADPDVIMIGEMRDHETAHAGVEASLTGHLVFSTLHTNSAPETITRLLDLGLDPISFSDALLGVLAQRLMRTLCNDCKQPYQATPEEYDYLKIHYGERHFDELQIDRNHFTLYRAKGCSKCTEGYRGRTGIHELLAATPAMKELIYRKATVAELKEQAMHDGMRTLMQDGIAKVLVGQSDFGQLKRIVSS